VGEKDFFEKVYEVCRQIPKGKVTTYGMLAKAIGSPQAARMVGWALNKSSNLEYPVPAHRVLNRNGILSGKKAFGNPKLMQELLEQEGHTVIDDALVNFEMVLWIPKLIEYK
jgi:methylated-DNA-protein-cysteine methyltransferase-like protein